MNGLDVLGILVLALLLYAWRWDRGVQRRKAMRRWEREHRAYLEAFDREDWLS